MSQPSSDTSRLDPAEEIATLILAATSHAVLACNDQGMVIRANPAVLSYCDGSPLLRPFAEAIPLRTAESGVFDLAPALRGETLSGVGVGLERHGQRLDFVLTAAPLLSGPRNLGCVVSLTEVSVRAGGEAACRDAEARYRYLFEQSPDGVVVIDPDTAGFLEFNEAAHRQLGYSREEFARLRVSDLEASETPDQTRARIASVIRDGRHDFESRHRTRRGDVRNIQVTAQSATLLGRGFYHCVWRDITELRQAEAALSVSEVSYRRLFESAKDGILILEAESGMIVDVNPYLVDLLGFARESFLGKRLWDLGFFKDIVANQESFAQLQREEFVRYEDKPLETSDGRRIDVEFVSNVYLVDGAKVIQCNIRNVTERRQARKQQAALEAQLQQAQKMESVGRLAGGVAHDFNNMLGVILGHADLALSQLDPAQPLHADLQEIVKAATRSAALTRQLLAFARKQTVVPQVLNLNETVGSMLSMLKRLIGEDIDLRWQPGPDVWPIKIDPSQIDQILANLCVNARDAISGVGRVTIETGNHTFDEAYCAAHAGCVPGEYVRLIVSDDGCGMEKEILPHLFEPFFTTKETGKGTGLGLATVYGIVKQNNGAISVYSEPAQGSTFMVHLPRYEGAAGQVGVSPAAAPAPMGLETILLVEDEPAVLAMTARMLEQLGYTVLAAAAPGDALRLAAEHAGNIDLLMTDVIMPEMNGRILAKTLLALYPKIRRLFMSGYPADVVAHRGVLEPGVLFIQKPFSTAEVAAKVREALDVAD